MFGFLLDLGCAKRRKVDQDMLRERLGIGYDGEVFSRTLPDCNA